MRQTHPFSGFHRCFGFVSEQSVKKLSDFGQWTFHIRIAISRNSLCICPFAARILRHKLLIVHTVKIINDFLCYVAHRISFSQKHFNHLHKGRRKIGEIAKQKENDFRVGPTKTVARWVPSFIKLLLGGTPSCLTAGFPPASIHFPRRVLYRTRTDRLNHFRLRSTL